MDTRISILINNIETSVENVNTVSYIQEYKIKQEEHGNQLPFTYDYVVHIYISSCGYSKALGHGDIFLYIDNNLKTLKGALVCRSCLNFIEFCQSNQSFYGITYREMGKKEQYCIFSF